MNNDTKYKISVMQAFEDGKEIEARLKGQWCWESVNDPAWDWEHNDYRIKPEPKPYDSVSEVDRDKWVASKNNEYDKCLLRIEGIDSEDNTVLIANEGWRCLDVLLRDYTYEDGTPCGKLAE